MPVFRKTSCSLLEGLSPQCAGRWREVCAHISVGNSVLVEVVLEVSFTDAIFGYGDYGFGGAEGDGTFPLTIHSHVNATRIRPDSRNRVG
jgi:hypothetical protein